MMRLFWAVISETLKGYESDPGLFTLLIDPACDRSNIDYVC